MIKVQHNIPKRVYVACSGGVDSMAALDFLSRKHEVAVLHFNHGTDHSDKAEQFVTDECKRRRIPYHVGRNNELVPSGESKENFWRNKRYEFFDCFRDHIVITCHHLDDCIETWVWSSLHGKGKIIPYRRGHVIRPFRFNRKETFEQWANKNSVKYIQDESNFNSNYVRNYIRNEMMDYVLTVNPGIAKTISKKVLTDEHED